MSLGDVSVGKVTVMRTHLSKAGVVPIYKHFITRQKQEDSWNCWSVSLVKAVNFKNREMSGLKYKAESDWRRHENRPVVSVNVHSTCACGPSRTVHMYVKVLLSGWLGLGGSDFLIYNQLFSDL